MLDKPTHSPLGASAAERWMNCPGSVKLIQNVVYLEEEPDPEYRKDGTAAHEAIAYCLCGSGFEPWEIVGEKFNGVEVTSEMADAIQPFIDTANELAAGAEETFIEAHLNSPDHPLLYGTVDFGAVKDGTLYIRDFKYGMGIVVETKFNPQMLYYAYLLYQRRPDVRRINMQIIQPRLSFAPDEAWEITAEDLVDWADNSLLPAMHRTDNDDTLCAGDHCRFCPVKASLSCPLLKEDFENAAKPVVRTEATVKEYPTKDLLAAWQKISHVKMHIKALEDEVLRRLMANEMPDNGVVKLVNKKANRVWKPEAMELFKSRFGLKALNEPTFKSPAEMEKLGVDAKAMVHEYAFTPQSGYTVATVDDKRPGIVIKKAVETFGQVLDEIE